MSETFDFVVVGGGSAGAVIASRLSEDPSRQVASTPYAELELAETHWSDEVSVRSLMLAK